MSLERFADVFSANPAKLMGSTRARARSPGERRRPRDLGPGRRADDHAGGSPPRVRLQPLGGVGGARLAAGHGSAREGRRRGRKLFGSPDDGRWLPRRLDPAIVAGTGALSSAARPHRRRRRAGGERVRGDGLERRVRRAQRPAGDRERVELMSSASARTRSRARSSGGTQTVGMVIPDVTNPFFSDLIWEVERALTEADYAVVFGNSANDGARASLSRGLPQPARGRARGRRHRRCRPRDSSARSRPRCLPSSSTDWCRPTSSASSVTTTRGCGSSSTTSSSSATGASPS